MELIIRYSLIQFSTTVLQLIQPNGEMLIQLYHHFVGCGAVELYCVTLRGVSNILFTTFRSNIGV